MKLDDGGLVKVVAAPERLFRVTANASARLLRLAWQLGGRHVAVEVGEDALFIPHDAALAELVRSQGGMAVAVERPFAPEPAHHDHHGHDHDAQSCGCASHGEDAPGHQHGRQPDHAHHHHGECGCGHKG
ncbi:urease accessory protein UreE [Blastochloris viridis]|uniref:Urease accessory protein UreE n=1 Tax=Blastochloris viridis TaxID=1079 RepID=A0A182D3K2_BLAVI|nr:urease accessory protein UreE [Blastochloris viridis]